MDGKQAGIENSDPETQNWFRDDGLGFLLRSNTTPGENSVECPGVLGF